MKHRIDQLQISKTRALLSIIILVLNSIGYYCLFYLTRETIRFFSITAEHDIWLLSDIEVKFYNTFFAFIAIVIGTSSAITFLMDRPIKLKRVVSFRTSVLNDQRALTWYFLAWISKLGIMYGFFFISFLSYKEFSFFPNYAFLFILIMIVLYLQLWTTIIRSIKINKQRLWFITSILFVIGSLLLGSLNLIDYHKINENVLSKNVFHKFELIKPESKYWTFNEKLSLLHKIYIVHEKENANEKPIVISGDLKIENLSELDIMIQKWKSVVPRNQIPYLQVQLEVNRKTQMKYVNDVKYELSLYGINLIGYGVVPVAIDGVKSLSNNCIIPNKIYNYNLLESSQIERNINQTQIEIDNDHYIINDRITLSEDLSNTIKEIILKSPDSEFVISYAPSTKYGRYIKLQTIILQTIEDLRNQFSSISYDKKYNNLERAKRDLVKRKYAIIIKDMNYISRFKKDFENEE